MKIKKLTIENFKGITNQDIDFYGDNATISGANETGKTTILDAVHWLQFDKDSQNSAKFDIKPIVDGKSVPGVMPTVTMETDTVILKKQLVENWRTKRGTAIKEFCGHKTKYWVNDVPVKQREYQQEVAKIAHEDKFKILSNPVHFNQHIDWKKRREVLIDMCGEVSNADVVKANKSFEEVLEWLEQYKVGKNTPEENCRKAIRDKMSVTSKLIETIPIRIDEANKDLKELRAKDLIENEIIDLESEKGRLQGEIDAIKSSDKDTIIARRQAEISLKMLEIINAAKAERMRLEGKKNEDIAKINTDISKKKTYIEYRQSLIQERERMLSGLKSELVRKEKAREELVGKWHATKKDPFSCEEKCPTCGQDIPESDITAAQGKFNENKAERLEEINSAGKDVKQLISKLKAEIQEKQKEIEGITEEITIAGMSLSELEEQLKAKQGETIVVDLNPEYNDLEVEQVALSKKRVPIDTTKQATEILNIEVKIDELKAEMTQYKNNLKIKDRILKYKKDEKWLGVELSDYQNMLNTLDAFIQLKVEMITDKVNKKFKITTFKLFRPQINEGIELCCEAMYKGIPYRSMNNAARINVGLDIIETLSKYYDISVPVFIDNAEGVDDIYKTSSQQIKMYVNKNQKTLNVERG